MKRILTQFVFLMVLVNPLWGQIPFIFEDALELRQGMSESNGTLKIDGNRDKSILAKYSNGTEASDVALNTRLNNENPYLKGLIQSPGAMGAGNPISFQSFSAFSASLSGLDVTNLADGLAKFLVERTKEELEVAFFDHFKEALEKEPDFAILFPQTVATLGMIDAQIYEFKRYINMIREAFYADLNNLPTNLPKWVNEGKLLENLDPNAKDILVIAVGVSASLLKGEHPGAMLNRVAENLATSQSTPLATSISATNIISQSLRSSDSKGYWLTRDQVMGADANVWKIYAGLLLEFLRTADGANIPGATELVAFLNVQSTGTDAPINELKRIIDEITKDIARAEKAFSDLQSPNAKDNLAQNMSFLAASSTNLIENAGAIAKVLNITLDQHLQNVVAKSAQVSDIFTAINAKHYSSAVAQIAILAKESTKDSLSEFVQVLFHYGGFLALLAEAESADDVQNAIELYALPTGSSRVKKESRFNIAVQSYVGLFYQTETADTNLALIGKHVGLTAPIGFSFSKGFQLGKNRSSITLFTSAIDVGALVHYRFTNSDSTIKNKISLGSIISPGVGLVWGLPKVPISLGATYTLGPLLERVSTNQNYTSDQNTWGFRAFIAVDIPLLNLYNVTRPLKRK